VREGRGSERSVLCRWKGGGCGAGCTAAWYRGTPHLLPGCCPALLAACSPLLPGPTHPHCPPTRQVIKSGRLPLLELEVEGTAAVKEAGVDSLAIFLNPTSIDEFSGRLRTWLTESDEEVGGARARAMCACACLHQAHARVAHTQRTAPAACVRRSKPPPPPA